MALAFLLITPLAHAHGMKTAYLEIVESRPGEGVAVWKLPVPTRDAWPAISGCTLDEGAGDEHGGGSTPKLASKYVTQLALHCDGPLAGRTIKVTGLGYTVGDVVVRISLADSSVASHVLGPQTSSWSIPAHQTWFAVFRRYVTVGIEHIFSGADHLLFVLGLVLLTVGRARTSSTLLADGASSPPRSAYSQLLWTATSFTLAHSITLSATVLGWLRVSSLAAEACIALSLVLVALDVAPTTAAAAQRQPHPRALAFVFGLVHGLGFAGALSEIGLPQNAMATALLSFNVGVELGQLAFIFVLLVALAAVGRLARRWPILAQAPQLAGAYAIGGLGVFWLVERCTEIMRSRG